MNNLCKLRGLFKGKDVWVLGNGPSIWNVPLGHIPIEKAIGCNRILKTHDCNFVVVVDDMVWEQEKKRFRRADMKLIVHDDVYSKLVRGNYPEHLIWTFKHSNRVPPLGSMNVLHYGYLTGYYAAEIACQMASPGGRVILAGMDLQYTDKMKENGETHASGDERPNGATDMRFKEGRESLCRLRIAASAVGVSMCVVPPSALVEKDQFPRYCL